MAQRWLDSELLWDICFALIYQVSNPKDGQCYLISTMASIVFSGESPVLNFTQMKMGVFYSSQARFLIIMICMSPALSRERKKSFCMFTSPLYFNQIRLNSQFGRLQSEPQEWSGSWRLYSSFSTLCYHPPNICIIKPRHMIKGYIAVNYHRDSGQKNPTGWNSEFNGASTLLLYTYKYDILITIMNSNKQLPRSPHCYWCLHHKPTVCDASALSSSLWYHGVIKPFNIRLSKIFPDYPVDNMEGLSNLWIIVK